MKKLIIFDVDGVLSKEKSLIKARHNHLIKVVSDKQKISIKKANKKYDYLKKNLPKDKRNTSAYVFNALATSLSNLLSAFCIP